MDVENLNSKKRADEWIRTLKELVAWAKEVDKKEDKGDE